MDRRNECSWIPTTPAKPILPEPRAIHAVQQENQLGKPNWSESERFFQWSKIDPQVNLLESDRYRPGFWLGSASDSINFSVDPKRSFGIPFGDLLALADAATTTAADKTQYVDSTEGNQVQSSSANLPFLEKHSSLGTNWCSTSNCILDTPQCESSIPSRLPYDLNLPPETIAEAGTSRITTPQFAPATPYQAKSLENNRVSDIQNTRADEIKNQAKVALGNKIDTTRGEESQLHHEKQQPQLLEESSSAAISTPMHENHNPDKGGNRGIDLNKTPQQKKRRKKHRPKVVIEGQLKRTRKPTITKPTGRRKYGQRNGLNNSVSNADPNTDGNRKKSCRRSLNFDSESIRDKSFSAMYPSHFIAESQSPDFCTRFSSEPGTKKYVLRNRLNKSTPMPISDVISATTIPNTVGNEETYCKRSLNFDFDTQVRDKSSSPMHPSPNFNSQSQVSGRKRTHSCMIDESKLANVTVKGLHCNALQEYFTLPVKQFDNQLLGLHFPAFCKKKRKVKGRNSATSWKLQFVKTAENSANLATAWLPNNACAYSFPSNTTSNKPTKVAAADNIQNKQKNLACMLALSHRERWTKKRSKGRTRVRDLASLIRIVESKQNPTFPARRAPKSGSRQGFEVSRHPHTCMAALLAEILPTMARKKRTRRKYLVKTVPRYRYDFQQYFTKAKGNCPDVIWKNKSPIDRIVEQLKQLDINGASNNILHQEQNALVPYNLRYREQKALVLYRRDGTVVPFEGSFDPVKKRRPRAKVELDEETNRVWKLLLENINSKGIDGTDEEKAKWWEEEREVFRGRADSFIARMHLILGDRRFSKWKGSVVDSVIGVFLTQNVSDHLSSSAFMSLAARFPFKSKSNNRSCSEERTGILVKEPDTCISETEDIIKWHDEKSIRRPGCDQNSATLHDIPYSEEIEVLDSNDTFESKTGGLKSANKSECKLFGYSENCILTYHESSVNRSNAWITETVAGFTPEEREMDDILSSQNSVVSSQNSVDFSVIPPTEGIRSCSQSNLEDLAAMSMTEMFGGSNFLWELLQMDGTTKIHGNGNHISGNSSNYKDEQNEAKSMGCDAQEYKDSILSSNNHYPNPNSGAWELKYINLLEEECTSDVTRKDKETPMSEESELMEELISQPTNQKTFTENFQSAPTTSCQINHPHNNTQEQVNELLHTQSMLAKNPDIDSETHEHSCQRQKVMEITKFSAETLDVAESASIAENPRNTGLKTAELNYNEHDYFPDETDSGEDESTSKRRRGRRGNRKHKKVDWDSLRKQAQANGKKRERTTNTMDSVDWEAVRCSDVNDIANTIRSRGMNNMLAERLKDFLNRLVKEHGSIDLEWLRDVPPDKAKEYLLSIRGLGLKSVECVRLLTLHHLAFPVDTNVGRIAVRLGWVPLQTLPESLQLHLLELYPVLESIQKYLWPRLCKLDQRTLYELHYQMITFGKVFCTKNKPNCNACPMRGECRHFASAFASARLALPGVEEKGIVCTAAKTKAAKQNPMGIINQLQLHLPHHNQQAEGHCEIKDSEPIIEVPASPEPIIEEPVTPEANNTEILESDIEDNCEDCEEIPTIELNIKEFTRNLQNYMKQNMENEEGDLSKALVALAPEAASIPMPKLKNVNRLRTEHQVYELPDSHPLLEGLDRREPDDPCSYLLAIWTPGETANSIEPPERKCNSQDSGNLCDKTTCFSCNSIREANSQVVRGTLLIPCRTAMRGSFPLNGTYFQVNEVFADHKSSITPIDVPTTWIWNLPRRMVYFGTSIPTIFKGLSTEGIQYCFWRGYVCVRGFDQKTRAPRPLMTRLHFPASKLTRATGKADDE